LGHVQYGFTPITVLILIIGLVLGLIRRRTNTTTAMIVHTGYNFVLGLLALLASFLVQ
ncbi:MAG: CPBP family intramembrane metalloprotease, partial [Anaerolineales bacterium]|nr:CPBP family intramembrane metalloprotease [Anaerolineales bacterium]